MAEIHDERSAISCSTAYAPLRRRADHGDGGARAGRNFNWSEYLEPKLFKAFEEKHGVKVRESNFDSMQGMMAKLRSGNRYDLIFPSSEWADRLRKANQLLEIDQAQVPDASTVYDGFAKPWYDPGADHTVPYAMYASGIIYRKDKVNHERVLERHRAAGGEREGLPARRLPGGPGRRQPRQRQRAQRHRRGRGRQVPSTSSCASRCRWS